jgi:hypothetical protein
LRTENTVARFKSAARAIVVVAKQAVYQFMFKSTVDPVSEAKHES